MSVVRHRPRRPRARQPRREKYVLEFGDQVDLDTAMRAAKGFQEALDDPCRRVMVAMNGIRVVRVRP